MKSRCFRFAEYGLPADVLKPVDEELPEPGPGQVLLKLSAVGLNRSEFNYVQGRYVPAREFPSGIGQEAVGEIVALGPPLENRIGENQLGENQAVQVGIEFETGARVALLPGRVDICAMGVYRDYGLYDRSALVSVPESFSAAEGAAYWMGILTMGGCYEMAGLTPENATGRKVLVTAATSSMGVIALKLARAWGAQTIATSRSADKAQALEGIADHVVTCSDSASLAAGVNEVTQDAGVDVAVDPVGADFYEGLLNATGNGGQIVSYEMITGTTGPVPIATMMIKDISIHGFTIFRVYKTPGLLDTLIGQGMRYADEVRPLIAKTYPLDAAPAALAELGESRHIGKIILQVE